MIELNAQTNLTPGVLESGIQSRNYQVCSTLLNMDNKYVNKTLKKIEGNQSNFLNYLRLEIPEVTAALFSNPKWLVCESYQVEVFQTILKFIKGRETDQAFYLIKVLCGPNIPFYQIRGIGMLKNKSDLYPSVIQTRDD
jgi:hypothetical protein